MEYGARAESLSQNPALYEGDRQASQRGAIAFGSVAPPQHCDRWIRSTAPPARACHRPAAHLDVKSVLRSHRETPSRSMAGDRPSAEGEASKHRRDVGCHGALSESSHGCLALS